MIARAAHNAGRRSRSYGPRSRPCAVIIGPRPRPRWPRRCAGGCTIVGAMIATLHILVGAAGVLKARSVGGALAIGALTHLALDAVPHRDYRPGALGGLALTAVAVLCCARSRRSPSSVASVLYHADNGQHHVVASGRLSPTPRAPQAGDRRSPYACRACCQC